MSKEVYIAEGLRTPVGRKKGSLKDIHPADMAATVIQHLVIRAGCPPEDVEEVIFGCVDSLGPNAGNIARTAWLCAGFPEETIAMTVDRQCGSSQQALHCAASRIKAGMADMVIAGGVQNMNMVPIASAMFAGKPLGHDDPWVRSKMWNKRYGAEALSQFASAERIAKNWDISRAEMESYALESHRRACEARDKGMFEDEILPLDGCEKDECPRQDTSLEKMATLDPIVEGGLVTAALASQNADASAALLVVSEEALKRHSLTPLARIVHMSGCGADPIWMLTAPIPATKKALKQSQIPLEKIASVEINEAFASIPLAWLKEFSYDPKRLNPVGGAIALGHPLGATGARLMVSLIHHLKQGENGLLTMCEGGGQANVTIVERL